MDHKEYRLAAVMFTDIVGFSRMMEADEAGTLTLMDYHNKVVRESVQVFGGSVIKTIGDAFLVEFPNANNAVRCGIEIQKVLENYNASSPKQNLVLRVGVHLGDIYFFENDALGEGINIASRLQSVCKPGRICISQDVYNLVSNKLDTPIKPLGKVSLKNISRDIHAFEILTNGASDSLLADSQTSSAKEETDTAKFQDFNSDLSMDEQKIVRLKVFELIKTKGRRVSLTEAQDYLNTQDVRVKKYLEDMVSKGFLSKASGTQNTGHGSSADYSSGQGSETYRHERREYRRSNRREGSDFWHEEFPEITREVGRNFKEIAQEIKKEIQTEIQKGKQKPQAASKAAESFNFMQVVEQQERNLRKEKSSFTAHMASFIPVNLGLWFIWFLTGGFVWPAIVTLAWGIGIVSHWATLRCKIKEQKELQAMPKLRLDQWNILRRFFKNRRNWQGHIWSNLATSVFLFLLNLMVSPGALWSLIPIAGMGIGIFSHLGASKSKEEEILIKLAESGVPIDYLGKSSKKIQKMRLESGIGPLGQEAEQYRKRILSSLKGLKGKSPLGSDFPKILDDYVQQIKTLSLRDQEVSILLNSLDMQSLQAEYDKVFQEMEKETDLRLKAEYKRTLEQIELQKKAQVEIVAEQKLLHLRLQNALNGLKRLEVDVARMMSLQRSGQALGTDQLTQKSEELRLYLDDLRQGYEEVEHLDTVIDPFEQLLKKAAEREALEKKAADSNQDKDLLSDSESPDKE